MWCSNYKINLNKDFAMLFILNFMPFLLNINRVNHEKNNRFALIGYQCWKYHKVFCFKWNGNCSGCFTNNSNAKVIERAKNNDVPIEVFSKTELKEGSKKLKIDWTRFNCSCGFLLKFPENIISAYPNKIINIHPALLPKYGGKGMYGMNVHKAIVDNNERETGITIHYVNEDYEEELFFKRK
jgi:phosphoribosylglycinamide formyltransferase-1